MNNQTINPNDHVIISANSEDSLWNISDSIETLPPLSNHSEIH